MLSLEGLLIHAVFGGNSGTVMCFVTTDTRESFEKLVRLPIIGVLTKFLEKSNKILSGFGIELQKKSNLQALNRAFKSVFVMP